MKCTISRYPEEMGRHMCDETHACGSILTAHTLVFPHLSFNFVSLTLTHAAVAPVFHKEIKNVDVVAFVLIVVLWFVRLLCVQSLVDACCHHWHTLRPIIHCHFLSLSNNERLSQSSFIYSMYLNKLKYLYFIKACQIMYTLIRSELSSATLRHD